MKDIYISELRTNQEFVSYFIVKTVAVKVGSNKKHISICCWLTRRERYPLKSGT